MWELKHKNSSDKTIRSYMEKSLEKLLAREDLGFKSLETLDSSIQECEKLSSFYKDKKKLVVVGLGGSSLGAKALCTALYPTTWSSKIEFLDNVDSFTVDSFLQTVDKPEDYGWVFISKSGSTMEVLSLLDYCYSFLQNKKSFSILKNSVVITEKKESPLRQFADKHSIPSLSVPEDVGGRFSVFTAVGLFPLGFLGLPYSQVRDGYKKALDNKALVVDLSSQLYESIGREEYNFYCFNYCDRLIQWSRWLQQLWSESLAKSLDRKGNEGPWVSTFLPCRGASDQHSVLQQIVEGREKKFVAFMRVSGSEKGSHKIESSLTSNELMLSRSIGELLAAEADATEQALNEVSIATLSLQAQDINPESMTSLMLLWMLTVGTLGEAYDINAFNQPGVESGKVLARRVLSHSH